MCEMIISTAAEDEESDGSELEAAGFRRCGDYKPEFSDDYYQQLAHSEHIRPIAVTEDVDFETMSFFARFLWWISTVIRLLRSVDKTEI